MKTMSIRNFIFNFDHGAFDSPRVDVQCDAGWYDWFCREQSLRNKTIALTKKLKTILESKKIDQDSMYVFFKNNCPMNGSLYDDFRICDMKTGDVVYTIIPSSGHRPIKGKAFVYGKENDFAEPLGEGKWKDVKEFFLS